jgi:hypothetical protein
MTTDVRQKLSDLTHEPWQQCHERAMKCRDLEDQIARLTADHDRVVELDEQWRHELATGASQYRDGDTEAFQDFFRRWAAAAAVCEGRARAFEAAGLPVDGATGLRERIACARDFAELEPQAN